MIFVSKEALLKALKELGRVALISIIPLLISSLEKGSIDLKAMAIVTAIACLKFIDKLIHEVGVEKEEETGEISKLTTGITRF